MSKRLNAVASSLVISNTEGTMHHWRRIVAKLMKRTLFLAHFPNFWAYAWIWIHSSCTCLQWSAWTSCQKWLTSFGMIFITVFENDCFFITLILITWFLINHFLIKNIFSDNYIDHQQCISGRWKQFVTNGP